MLNKAPYNITPDNDEGTTVAYLPLLSRKVKILGGQKINEPLNFSWHNAEAFVVLRNISPCVHMV